MMLIQPTTPLSPLSPPSPISTATDHTVIKLRRAINTCTFALLLAGLLDFRSRYFNQGSHASEIYNAFRFGVGLLGQLICIASSIWILVISYRYPHFKAPWHRKFAMFAGSVFALIAALNIYAAFLTRFTP